MGEWGGKRFLIWNALAPLVGLSNSPCSKFQLRVRIWYGATSGRQCMGASAFKPVFLQIGSRWSRRTGMSACLQDSTERDFPTERGLYYRKAGFLQKGAFLQKGTFLQKRAFLQKGDFPTERRFLTERGFPTERDYLQKGTFLPVKNEDRQNLTGSCYWTLLLLEENYCDTHAYIHRYLHI